MGQAIRQGTEDTHTKKVFQSFYHYAQKSRQKQEEPIKMSIF